MIFVALGTSMERFDELIHWLDSIEEQRFVFQVGYSEVSPTRNEYFRFTDRIEQYYDAAELVICTGGAGTMFECLERGKRVLVVPNFNRDALLGPHNRDLALHLAAEGYLGYCDRLEQLPTKIDECLRAEFRVYRSPKCELVKEIREYLAGLS